MSRRIYLILFSSLLFLEVFAQYDGIDPRQFVSVHEFDKDKLRTIQIWNDSIEVPIVDNEGVIRIKFDHEQMSQALNYYGNVSIAATINDEPVKVSPYSKVGEKRDKVGVKSASPIEISSHLLGMMKQLYKLEEDLFRLEYSTYVELETFSNGSANYYKELISYLEEFDDTLFRFNTINERFQKEIRENSIHSGKLVHFIDGTAKYKKADIIKVFNDLNNEFQDDNSEYLKSELESEREALISLSFQFELTRDYLSYFLKEDERLSEIFLRLYRADRIAMYDFMEKLSYNIELLTKLDTISPSNYQSIRSEILDKLKPTTRDLYSYIEKLKRTTWNLGMNFDQINLTTYELDSLSSIDSSKIRNDVNETALRVGQLIYQNLFDGEIDLREARANSGDVLKITVLWYRSNGEDAQPMELPIGSFTVKEVGWSLKAIDSFFLIDRYSTPDNKENLSPSQFKGAPGVSLMLSYRNNRYKNNILKRLEPSLGINVSYVDFYTDKDLEIGAGLVCGILANQILFTVGYNLHSNSNGGYIGLGFSFASIAQNFSENKEN